MNPLGSLIFCSRQTDLSPSDWFLKVVSGMFFSLERVLAVIVDGHTLWFCFDSYIFLPVPFDFPTAGS